ncbi:MAG: VOC family protein [Actinobacteria bacterium]|nr:VOC family protein [Actinomycetota bacterium]
MQAALIHTMIRVVDEARSLAFYSAFGFEERRRARVGGDTATIIMLGLPGDDEPRLELTLNDGRTEPYAQGDAYGHIALAIDDMDEALATLAEHGIAPEREPYAAYPGGSRICFVRDPDDYRVELIERRGR